jgi:putative membrane protein
MTWWCAASDAAWRWSWTWYPGAWASVALLVFGFSRLWRRIGAGSVTPRERTWLALGALALWAAIDWPIGALGAGYLSWVHTVQFILISLVAAPLLLLAIPSALLAAIAPDSGAGRRLRALAHPVLGLLVFNGLLGVTHLPAVVDTVMPSQLGNFGVDLAWLAGGLALWWPVIAPPGIARISPPMQIGYLFVATIPPTVPAAFLTFAKYPLYAVYELAPRVPGMAVAAQADQQLSGLIMKVIGDPILWLAMAIVFFRWARSERAGLPVAGPAPGTPG